jgi:hypothetical protein
MASRDKDRDQDKPSADLLRRSLASAARVEDVCPDAEILAAYADRSLDAEETARYELHFSQCARCRDMLAAMVRGEQPTSVAGEKRAPSSNAAWIWDWRWLAPAAAAIVLAAVWLVRGPLLNHPAAPQPQMFDALSPTPAAPPPPLPAPEPANAASAPAAGASSTTGALQRVAPNLDSEKFNIAPRNEASPQSSDDLKKFAANAPLRSRNGIEADKTSQAAAAPKADSLESHGIGIGHGNANGVATANSAQSVTVESAAAPIVTAPRAPTAAPPPPEISAGDAVGTGRGNGIGPGGTASATRVAPQADQQNSMSAAVISARSMSAREMVTVDSAADRDARTLVQSPDPQVLWRISGGRYVERSGDAGVTWKVQWTSPGAHVIAGASPSVDTCWLVGRGGIILVTSDGRKWRTITPPVDVDFSGVEATDASSATVTTTDDRKFTTTDGGKRWTPAP